MTGILMAFHSNAQKTYLWGIPSGGEGNDFISEITVSGTDIYVAGTFGNSFQSLKNEIKGEGRTDIFLTKYDKNGNVNWLKALAGEGANKACCINSNEKNIYLAGIIEGNVKTDKQEYTGSGKALFVSCWDDKGKIHWLTRVPFTGNTTLDILEINPDGSLVIGGMFQDTLKAGAETIVCPTGKKAYIIEFTSLGNVKKTANSMGSENHRLVAATTDKEDGSRYYLFNITGDFTYGESPVIENKNIVGSNLILLKTNIDGDYKWTREIKGEGYLEGMILQVATNHNILVGINYNNLLMIGDIIFNTDAQLEASVLSFSEKGDFDWATRLKSPVKSRIMDAQLFDSGNLVIAGYFRSSFEADKWNVYSDQSWDELFILQMDEDGKVVWYDNPGNDAPNFCKSFAIDKQGNMILAGGFRNEIKFKGDKLSSVGGTDILVAKYESCGDLDINIRVDGSLCPGETVELNVSGNFKTYFWNDEGMGTKNFTVESPGQYHVVAYDKRGCPAYDTIDIFETTPTSLELGPDQTISAGQTTELLVDGDFTESIWSNGEMGNSILCRYDPDSDSLDISVTALSPEGCNVSDSITIFFAKDLKVAGINHSELQVYPNPASNDINWLLKANVKGDAVVALFGGNSNILYRKEFSNYTPVSNRIDVRNLASGNYILKVEIDGQIFTESVVIN